MKLNFTSERVLAVMAHPDDAELLCAGTLARAKADGAAIGVCVMCKGDKGLPPEETPASLADARWGEAKAAAKLLGAELFWQGNPDAELSDDPAHRRGLMETMRRFNPTLVLTHAPEDYHPDHKASGQLVQAASWFCSSRGHVTESAAMAKQPAVWFVDTIAMHDFAPEFYVDVSAQMQLKRDMMQCHQTQLRREKSKDFAPLMQLMLRQCAARGDQAGVAAAEAFRSHHAFKRVAAW
jgi:LmbE family N-acetylglucosaminyl deacetylase